MFENLISKKMRLISSQVISHVTHFFRNTLIIACDVKKDTPKRGIDYHVINDTLYHISLTRCRNIKCTLLYCLSYLCNCIMVMKINIV